MRGRAWRRYKNYTKAKRKAKIVHDQNNYWYYPHFGQYVKGKINCSCPMCRRKTRNRGIAAYYHGAYNWKPSDKKKIDSLKFDFDDKK